MDSLSSKPTSHSVVESFDEPKTTEDPKVLAKDKEEKKEEEELNKLLEESMAVYKTAIVNTINTIRKGDDEDGR